MKYICTHCNYIYDDTIGDQTNSLVSGTIFDELSESWECPGCFGAKDLFMALPEQITYIENQSGLDPIEKSHTPLVEIKDGKLYVSAGIEEEHAMGQDHFISSISLYDEYGDLIQQELYSYDEDLLFVFDIEDFDEFEIRLNCSIHGIWAKKFICKNI